MGSDWEDLMSGVFGSGGKLNFAGAEGRDRAKQAQDALAQAQKELEATLERQRSAKTAADAVSGEQLLKNSAALDEQLKRQAREISEMGRDLTHNMQQDGLLSPQEARKTQKIPGPGEAQELFRQAAEEAAGRILGQKEFVASLLGAFQRPFVMGAEGEGARNVILVCGPAGTGRHYVLTTLVQLLEQKNLLAEGGIAWMDLGLYAGPAQEKLFLQDLYAALAGPGQVVAFENCDKCHAGCLAVLADLAVKGAAPLATRYVVQKGMLVEAGTALVPGAVSRLTPQGKYLVFLAPRGPQKLADLMGVPFVNAARDVCTAAPFAPAELRSIALAQLNEVSKKARERLGLRLALEKQPEGEDVASLAVAAAKGGGGGRGNWCGRCFAALAEYTLRRSPAPDTALTLSRGGAGQVLACADGEEPFDLLALLPREYTAALDEVKAELDQIVGLGEVKDYVLGLEDNVKVQRRRAEAGMKTASISMHMIFTGNPGTGKTTIARLVGKYLKAIGALSGGQLVEVSRADLVGRYVGHTAPLTNKVIQSAIGGVLFIDEAYALCRGKDDSFGLEAIDALVKGMEDNREDLVVILAGYTKEMGDFLQANSGLKSRFPNQIEFPDYTGEELLAITRINAKSRGYRLAEGCDAPLQAFYDRAQAQDAAKNGNGRLARNKLEEAILNQSRRVVAQPDAALDELLPGDFELDEKE